nr:MAG TPA: hypothetical protein [Caudoviricetes sp.]
MIWINESYSSLSIFFSLIIKFFIHLVFLKSFINFLSSENAYNSLVSLRINRVTLTI